MPIVFPPSEFVAMLEQRFGRRATNIWLGIALLGTGAFFLGLFIDVIGNLASKASNITKDPPGDVIRQLALMIGYTFIMITVGLFSLPVLIIYFRFLWEYMERLEK